MEMKKFNYILEIDILRSSSQKDLGVLRGVSLNCLGVQKMTCWLRLCPKGWGLEGFGCPKDALLAKTLVVVISVWKCQC